jgi:hypothetical protein
MCPKNIQEYAMRKMLTSAMIFVFVAATTQGEAAKSVRLVLPEQRDSVVENIACVFVRQVESRCAAKVVREGDAPFAVELAIEPGIGEEGFKITDAGLTHLQGLSQLEGLELAGANATDQGVRNL